MAVLRERRKAWVAATSVVLMLCFASQATAIEKGELLADVLRQSLPDELFRGAERVQLVSEQPLIAEAVAMGSTIGYLYVTTDFVDSIGYSGRPIHTLVAIDTDAVIRGGRLLEHHEPIVLTGIPESKIRDHIDRLNGLNLIAWLRSRGKDHAVDAISGATVTVRVIDDSILRSAFKVASLLGLGGLKREERPAISTSAGKEREPTAQINPDLVETRSWSELVATDSVAGLRLKVADVSEAFARSGAEKAASLAEADSPDAQFIELYVAPASVPSIGLSLLGEAEYANLPAGRQALLIMGRGLYSFKGSGYVRGGIFDRFELAQGERVIRFRDDQHKRLRTVAADGAPRFKEVDLFFLPEDTEFNIAEPWSLELLISRAIGPIDKAFIAFPLAYQIPEQYLLPSDDDLTLAADAFPGGDTELWQSLWWEKLPEIILLSLLLAVLTLVFFFQSWVARRPRLLYWGRITFLCVTLFGLGFYANAQLSVVNILTVFNALISGFNWQYFLMEPLIFLLWGGVLMALVLWGRGVYCGWLCPFGALQELLNKLAKACRIKQLRVPWGVHERLWAVKYILFMALFGVSLHSLAKAEWLAELEPFKTAIILKFIRDWPFVLYAVLLLLPGLFIERFYCRYLCMLGAALAIPGRLHTFEWLRRYHKCGNPCDTCARQCMVEAIHPEGHIDPNECLHCLHCQQVYYDEHVCPVMVAKRKKRERRQLWGGA